jgi:hypothetical protein
MSRIQPRTPLKAADSYYTMKLSASSVTVRAGHRTRIAVSFQTTAGLAGTPVALSVSGLPSGVTASFSPPATTIGSRSVLTLTTASSTRAGEFAANVIALTLSSDPIGTRTALAISVP